MALQFRPRTIPTDEELEYLNTRNHPLRFERTLDGALVVSPPTGFATGSQNSELNRQLANWNKTNGNGKVLDSSTGVSIGLNAAPDAGWISGARVRTIPRDGREKFLAIAPEIVFELRSPSESRPSIARKAVEWVTVGVAFAVVLDPKDRTAVVYDRSGPGAPVRSHLGIDRSHLPGATADLVLDLDAIFDAG